MRTLIAIKDTDITSDVGVHHFKAGDKILTQNQQDNHIDLLFFGRIGIESVTVTFTSEDWKEA